jgi:methionine sulfoxide reductase heme-binding subunit
MDEQTIRLLLRITARVSFLFFLSAFVGAALSRLWPAPITRWLDENRRGWLLAFAASHTVHLTLILALATKLGSPEFLRQVGGWVTPVLGGVGYLLIYGLAAAAAIPNGTKWLRSPGFQAFAYYLIWTVFARAFVRRSVHSAFYVQFVFAAIAALSLRLLAGQQARKLAALSTVSR